MRALGWIVVWLGIALIITGPSLKAAQADPNLPFLKLVCIVVGAALLPTGTMLILRSQPVAGAIGLWVSKRRKPILYAAGTLTILGMAWAIYASMPEPTPVWRFRAGHTPAIALPISGAHSSADEITITCYPGRRFGVVIRLGQAPVRLDDRRGELIAATYTIKDREYHEYWGRRIFNEVVQAYLDDGSAWLAQLESAPNGVLMNFSGRYLILTRKEGLQEALADLRGACADLPQPN